MKKAIMIMGAVILALLIVVISAQGNYNALEKKNENLELSLNTLNGVNSSLRSKQSELENEITKLKEHNSALSSDKQKLQSDFDELSKNSAEWLALSQTEKDAAKAKAEADKTNAEAEKIEAEARLKTANKQLSQAQAEEQRRATEGTTVYEDSFVKINFFKIKKHYSNSRFDSVVFLVENKTNYVLEFQAECISLDGMDVGDITMSDPISPQSKGYIYADYEYKDKEINLSPSTISGQLRVIDFNKKLLINNPYSYNADFINVVVG